MDKIILADNSEIEVSSMPSLGSITVKLDAITETETWIAEHMLKKVGA